MSTAPDQPAPRTVAVILCAGQGSRMRADRNKIFLPLAGRPLLLWTLAAFAEAPEVDEVVLVAHPQEVVLCAEVARGGQRGEAAKVRAIIPGGQTRHQSEQAALDALRPRIERGEIGAILIHDGARPLVTGEDMTHLLAAVRAVGSAILVAPFTPDDVLLRTDDAGNLIAQPTSDLARAQTPQAFTAALLLRAYDAARADGFEGTDTAASVERLGQRVAAVVGTGSNLKITTPDDLLRAEAILQARGQSPA